MLLSVALFFVILIAVAVLIGLDAGKILRVAAPVPVGAAIAALPLLLPVLAAVYLSGRRSGWSIIPDLASILMVMVLCLYLVIKSCVTPLPQAAFPSLQTKLRTRVRASGRVLSLALFANLLYFLLMILLVTAADWSMNGSVTFEGSFHALLLILAGPFLAGALSVGLLLVFFPAVAMSGLMFVVASFIYVNLLIALAVSLALSLTGVIRAAVAVPKVRRLAALYILLLFVPIANIADLLIVRLLTAKYADDLEKRNAAV